MVPDVEAGYTCEKPLIERLICSVQHFGVAWIERRAVSAVAELFDGPADTPGRESSLFGDHQVLGIDRGEP